MKDVAPRRVDLTRLDHVGYVPHRDDFTIRDDLNRRALVRSIAEVAAKGAPPMALGVHGDWGSGKTSVLRSMQHHMTGENLHSEEVQDLQGLVYSGHVATVWFEAWRYQNEATPIVALLHEMRRQMSGLQKTWAKSRKLTGVAFEAVLGGLDKAAKLIGAENAPVSVKEIREIGERYERERMEQALPTDTIQEFLQQTIDSLLPLARKDFPTPRVVVFIDDLDRCNPESAFRLLEGLKLYLQLKNCVFVLGMNQQIVIEAIGGQLKKDDNDKAVLLRAEAYLEKLCSNIWRLPLPSRPERYFADLIDNDVGRAAVAAAAADGEAAGNPPFLPPNPRRLRTLANIVNRMIQAASQIGQVMDADACLRLLVVAYVYQFHADLFQRWHYDVNFLLRIKAWLETPSTPPAAAAAAPETAALPIPQAFARLSLPSHVRQGGLRNATPGAEIESGFPDPSAPGIFWIAPLLQTALKSAVPAEFKTLLQLVA